MILVPIGRDETTVRRNPWVSWVVIALNVAVFLVVNLGTERVHLGKLEARYLELVNYIQSHPYLDLPESVRPYFHESLPSDMGSERAARRLGGTLPDSVTMRRQQAELDRMSTDLASMVRELPSRKLGFAPEDPSFVTRLTSLFVHADIFHLLGNLLFFFATGPFLEDVFGKPLFSALYLMSGIVATFAWQSQHPGTDAYLIGASGAIAGVMGAYFLRFLRARTQFLCIPFILLWRLSFKFFMPAYVVFPFWFAVQVLFAMTESSGETSTAFSAHVGGFVVGIVTTGLVKFFRIEEKHIDPSITAKISWSRDPNLDRADDARRSGDLAAAKRHVRASLSAEPDNPDARLLACDIARDAEDWDAWSSQVAGLLDLYARRREPELAVQLIDDSIRNGGSHLTPRVYLRAADLLARMPDHRDWARDLYQHVADTDGESATGVRALLRVAQLARQANDMPAARAALEKAQAHPATNAEYAQAIDLELQRLV